MLTNYDNNWRQDRNRYQLGTEDNFWWFNYRKQLKAQCVIEELKFIISEAYSYYNDDLMPKM